MVAKTDPHLARYFVITQGVVKIGKMAGRPPKPKSLHVLEGTFREDRHGSREDVLAGGRLVKPEWLSDAAGELWGIVVGRFPEGALSDVDGPALAMLCSSYDRWRHYATADGIDEYKAATMAAMFAKQFVSLASRFGMTPADRAKLSLDHREVDNDEIRFFGA